MYVIFAYEVIIWALLFSCLLVWGIRLFKKIPAIKLSLVFLLLAGGIFIFKNHLSKKLTQSLNTFHITFHNGDKNILKKFKSIKIGSINGYYGNTLYVNNFADKKIYRDEDKDFYALMEGSVFSFKKIKKSFGYRLTWAKAKVFIDGKMVKELKGGGSYEHEFSAGLHEVKVKIYNIETTTTVMYMKVEDFVPELKKNEVFKKLEPYLQDDPNLYYTYGFNKNNLHIKNSIRPTILFLYSTYGTSWNITNCKKANVKAVVYNGVGTDIKSNCENLPTFKAPLTRLLDLPSADKCKDYAPSGVTCPYVGEYKKLNTLIKEYTKGKLTGFGATKKKHTNDSIVPKIELNSKKYKSIDKELIKIEQKKEKLTKIRKDAFYFTDEKRYIKNFDVKENEIPKNTFLGLYAQSKEPTKVIYSKVSDKILLYFDREGFHGVRADDMIALWVGDFEFKKDSKKLINISLSWAKTRLLVDGKVVYEGNRPKRLEYEFKKGAHRIELEFQSNYWHVGFSFKMQNPPINVSKDIQKLITKDTKLYYFGLYSSYSKDLTVDAMVKSKDPSILFLSSYDPLTWNIKNAKNVKAIVYNSHRPISTINVDNKNVKIFYDKDLRSASRIIPLCYDDKHCEGVRFPRILKHIKELTGRKLDGVSSNISIELTTKPLKRSKPKLFLIPQMRLDESTYKKIDKILKKLPKR